MPTCPRGGSYVGRPFLVAGTAGSEEVVVHDFQILDPRHPPPRTALKLWRPLHLSLHRPFILLPLAAAIEARVLLLTTWLGWAFR